MAPRRSTLYLGSSRGFCEIALPVGMLAALAVTALAPGINVVGDRAGSTRRSVAQHPLFKDPASCRSGPASTRCG